MCTPPRAAASSGIGRWPGPAGAPNLPFQSGLFLKSRSSWREASEIKISGITSRARGHIRPIGCTYGEIPSCGSSCMAQQKRRRSPGLIGLNAGSLHNRAAASAHCRSHVHISEECCYQSQSRPSASLLLAVRTPVCNAAFP